MPRQRRTNEQQATRSDSGVESNETLDGFPVRIFMPSGSRGNEYPRTVAESIDDYMLFRRATRKALRRYANAKPWRGTQEERLEKMRACARQLAAAYDKPVPTIIVRSCEGGDCYSPGTHAISLGSNLSVLTFLHEFAHHLGKNERGACRWSINLFKRHFPRSFARLVPDGHCLRRAPEGNQS